IPYCAKKIEAPPHRPTAQKIQPTAFPGRREAMMAPTVGKASAKTASIPKDSSNRSAKEPFRDRKRRPNAANVTESTQTDQASGAAIQAEKRSAISFQLFVGRRIPQPQRDVLRLHRLLDHSHQIGGQ